MCHLYARFLFVPTNTNASAMRFPIANDRTMDLDNLPLLLFRLQSVFFNNYYYYSVEQWFRLQPYKLNQSPYFPEAARRLHNMQRLPIHVC